jgi:hypothetical protein
MKSGTNILHKHTSNIILERFIQFTETFYYLKTIPLITRSSKLFMLASAFSLTYGATISRSDVYYFIVKRPLTESSRIFITYSDMNYFYFLGKDLHRLSPFVYVCLSYIIFLLFEFLYFESLESFI